MAEQQFCRLGVIILRACKKSSDRRAGLTPAGIGNTMTGALVWTQTIIAIPEVRMVNYADRIDGRVAWEKLNGFKKFLSRTFGKKWFTSWKRRDGWSSFLPFYLFWCPLCESPSKDYPHGHPERQYLICQNPNCEATIPFVLLRTRFLMFWSAIAFFARLPKLIRSAPRPPDK